MDLAEAAPRVSQAAATLAPAVENASAAPAVPRKSPEVQPAPATEPAETVDDPQKYAPSPTEVDRKVGGASVEALRGTSGEHFESRAAVLRGLRKNFLRKFLPFIFDERDFVAYGEALRFVLVKGDNCFVFTEETDIAPLYAIPLYGLTAVVEDPNKPDPNSITISPSGNNNIANSDLVTVLLKKPNGKISYQFTFDKQNDDGIAQRFVDVIKRSQTIIGDKTTSIAYAEAVAKNAKNAQPHTEKTGWLK